MLPYCPGLPASCAELGFRPRSGRLQSEHLVPRTRKAADQSLQVENQEGPWHGDSFLTFP